jgi:predicted GNAT family N-acyltransferase
VAFWSLFFFGKIMENIKILNGNGLSGIYDDSLQIRKKVFIEEQGIPPELEYDDQDGQAEHFVAYLNDVPVSTARVISGEGSTVVLGRVAAIKEYRHKGITRKVIERIEEFEKEIGCSEIQLHAQSSAILFYQKMGYVGFGEPFEEAGIEHLSMRKRFTE